MVRVTAALALACGVLLSSGVEAASRKKTPVKISGVLNLNQATVSQLDLLPGVGEKAAKRIIAHREKTPFKRPEELVKVKGFGKKKFDKLKPYLTVSGPTTLAVQREGTAQGRTPGPGR